MANKTGTNSANKLKGTNAADTLTGLGGNDTLEGLGGADIINGGTGNDSMVGGAGNDTYYVDSKSDVIKEAASGGTADRVLASLDYTLPSTQRKSVARTTLRVSPP